MDDLRCREELAQGWKRLVTKLPDIIAPYLVKETDKVARRYASLQEAKAFVRSRFPDLLDEVSECVKPKNERHPHRQIVYVDTKSNKPCTFTVPLFFQLQGQSIQVNDWKDLLLKLCERAFEDTASHDLFLELVLLIRGRRRGHYFTQAESSPQDSRNRRLIPGTSDIYVDTNLSATNIKGLCDALVKVFDYGEELNVTYK